MPRYKRLTAAAILLFFGLWTGYLLLQPVASTRAAGTLQAGEVAPSFALQRLSGQSLGLAELRGRPVLVNFFTTWCPACRAEAPLLQAAYQQYQGRGLVVLAVDLAESEVPLRAFAEKFGITYPIVVDKGEQVARAYGVIPLPTSYFVDRNGTIAAIWPGGMNQAQLQSLLNKIL